MEIRCLTDALRTASRHEDKGITFIQGSHEENFVSYKELYEQAERLLGYFQENGLTPGDEVLFQIEDDFTFLGMFWACVLGGFIPVPVSVGNNDEHKRKLFQIWQVLRHPVLLITDKSYEYVAAFAERTGLSETWSRMRKRTFFADQINPASGNKGRVHEAAAEDTLFIQFSSGSTGEPKGVVLTHENLLSNLNAIINSSNIDQHDVTLSWMPLTHDMGLIGCHMVPIVAQIQQYFMPTSLFIRRPTLWMVKCIEHRATVLSSPNFGYRYFLNLFKPEQAADWDLSHVRLIFNGAEPISDQLVAKFMDTLAPLNLKRNTMFPVYGMAEASLAITFPPIDDELHAIHLHRHHLAKGNVVVEVDEGEGLTFVDVGYPVDDCQVRIGDSEGAELPELTIGEILIKGKNVTSGYYNNEVATAKLLTSEGWLHTGDLGLMRNGRLFVTGRAKDIIFVNGQNVYPHDIERVCEAVETIELGMIAACGASNAQTQSDDVLLFVLFRKKLKAFAPLAVALRHHVQQQLGIEIKHVVPVNRLPKTTSGKIQRYKLGESYQQHLFDEVIGELSGYIGHLQQERVIIPPTTQTEERLLTIFQSLYTAGPISVTDNLFELGGNSLQLTYLQAKIRQEFQVKLSLHEMFHHSTIEQMAALIEEFAPEAVKEFAIVPVETREVYPATPAQRRMYAWQQLNEQGRSYNICSILMLEGAMTVERVEQAWQALVKRHGALRTSFDFIDGQPVQRVAGSLVTQVAYEEQLGLSDIQTYADVFVQSYDLHQAPLWRTKLVKIAAQRYMFLTDIHHSIADGTSLYVIMQEFLQLLTGQALHPAPVSFADYAVWLQEQPLEERHQTYWLEELAGELPVLEMPTDYPRPALLSDAGDRFFTKMDEMLVVRCKQFALQQNISLYMLLLAAYKLMLSQCAGQEDLIVGTSAGGRTVSGVERTAGMFVQTLALRSQPTGHKSVSDYLRELRDKTLLALEHQDYPFDQLIDKLDMKRDASRNPLFDTMFVLLNMEINELQHPDLHVERYPYAAKTSKFDFSLLVEEMGDTLSLEWEYCTALYERETIAEMSLYYSRLLHLMCDGPERKLAELSALNASQHEQLLQMGIGSVTEYPRELLIHWLFEDQATLTPDRIAVVFDDKTMTYRELDEKANRLARVLIANGVKRDTLAAILLPPSLEQVVSILAVFKAGGAYLPIDAEYPAERIAYLLQDSQTSLLLTDEQWRCKLDYTGKMLDVFDPALLAEVSSEPVERIGSPRQLAYVIYTSGSTGKPKGVMVEQQGLVNYIWWAKKVYLHENCADFPLYSSISFDLTVTSIFTPLITGGKIVIYGEDKKELVIRKIFKDNSVQIVKLTPSHLKFIKDLDNRHSSIQTLIVGGEQLDTRLAREVSDSFGGQVAIYNEYGPTETVVGCMIYRFDTWDSRVCVPVGKAADNVEIYLLNDKRQLVPKYSIGEMYIAGDGVARGYLHRPDLTQDRFVTHPFAPDSDRTMYRTGDLARWLPDGNMEYIGRIDNQVKIRGYRIEIQEVEHEILQLASIQEAVVLAQKDALAQTYLCAYVVAAEPVSLSQIRRQLNQVMPSYMIPAYVVQIDKVPLTPNGKVNRDALPEPHEHVQANAIVEAPRNALEVTCARVWSEVLEVNEVGVYDEFYDLGGDSIKAIQVSSRLKQAGVPVEMKQILQYQTISLLCEHLDINVEAVSYEQGLISGEKGLFPIDHWFFEQQLLNMHHYHQSVLLEMRQPIHLDRLQTAFEYLVRHHDGLRLNYNVDRHTLFFQTVHADAPFLLCHYDLAELPSEQKMSEIEAVARHMKSTLNISEDLLIRAAVFTFDAGTDYVLISAHHLVVDGVSWRILLEDLRLVYEQLSANEPVVLPSKTASLQDWDEGLQQYAEQPGFRLEEEYWRSVLEQHWTFPQDKEVEDWSTQHCSQHTGWLSAEDTEALLKQAHQVYKTEPLDLMLSALARTMHLQTGTSVIEIELENHGRHLDDVDVSRTVGWFTALYPVKLELLAGPLSKQIQSVKEQLRQIPDKGFGYGVLAYMNTALALRDEGPAPFRFNYLGQFGKEAENEWFQLVSHSNGPEISPVNRMSARLELNCLVINGMLRLDLMYHNEAFRMDTIEQWMDVYVQQLREIIEHALSRPHAQFTPSDFETVEITQHQLDLLFK